MRLLAWVAIIVALAGCGSQESETAKAERNQREQCESRTAAYQVTREFVADRLKAPSSAKFASYRDSRIEPAGKCRFAVLSFVDAQNSFGADVRTRYGAIVEYIPATDSWHMRSLDID